MDISENNCYYIRVDCFDRRCPKSMSAQGKQLEFWEFPLAQPARSAYEPLDAGRKRARLKRSALKADSEDTTSQALQLSLAGLGLPSSMPAFHHKSKKKTCCVNVSISNLNTLTQSLLQKLEEDLTTKEKKCWPYWNESCQEMSNVLWSHIKIDSADLDSIYSIGSVPSPLAKSWFSTKLSCLPNGKWLRISLPSSTVFQQDYTDSESTCLKSRKIRVYPDPNLHRTWKRWLAATRYCFNQAIECQRKNGFISKYDLRKIVLSNLPDWVSQTPYSCRVQAVYDAKQAFDNSRKNGKRQHEAGKFRSIRDRIQSIKFRQEDYKNGTWFPRETKNLSFKSAEPLPVKDVEYQQKQKDGKSKTRYRLQSWEKETQLVYDKKRWFAVFTVEFTPAKSESQKIIALDPGARTFMTGFDGEKFVEIGSHDIKRIYRLCNHIDKLISGKSQLKGRPNKYQRQKLQRKIDRMFIRVRNLVDEAHKKAAVWLTSVYRVVFLPTFETSQMVAKNGNNQRNINSKTVRQMLGWAHYRFKQTLKFHALKRGCHVVDVTEEYTSKTCTKCGHVHTKLGGSRVFKCPHCRHTMPRDWNGALGIFLKALRDIAGLDGFTDSVTLCPVSDRIVWA